jgi:hypothetical protein
MAAITQIVREYARMWPREVFYQLGPNASGKGKNVHPYKGPAIHLPIPRSYMS